MTPQALAENKIEALHLLVVSREPAVLGPLASLGKSNRWTVETAASGWDAMERLQSGGTPQLLLLDLPRGDHDNLHMLRWLRRLRADLPVIAFCDAEADETRKEATRLGAEEILSRPVDEHQLESVICKRLGAASQLKAEMMSESVEQLDPETSFVSASPVMRKLRAQADLLAQADVPVLIHGEAGSGKETVARLIHKLSVRSGFRFLNVNCAAMPGDLLESELFGGGPAKAAEKGTIFLDEIAEMPGKLQVRLLEALQNDPLQNHELRPAQAVPPSSSARILAATSADLERVLAEKKLREDLYYRLSAFTVRVPPLRQRKEEITILLRYSMHQMARHYGLPAREFTSVMLSNCQNYSWPGNLSELESFVKRYLVSGDQGLAPGGIELQTHTTGATRTYRTPVSTIATPERTRQESPAAQAAAPQSLKLFIQGIKCEAEKNAIGAALEKTGWNRKAAARLLKVSYRTLLYKIEQYQMTASLPSLSATSARYGAEGNENKESGR